jgi:parallel beta-helix repeat protein
MAGGRRAGLVVSVWMVFIVLVAVFGVVLNVPVVRASGTIYIRADGSIDPPTAPIATVDNVTYTFTANINSSIVVERSNIIVDGSGYTLEDPESAYGFFAVSEINVTIKNINIRGFYDDGLYLNSCSDWTVIGNNITHNGECGIYVTYYSLHINICGNNITENRVGIWVFFWFLLLFDLRKQRNKE